MFKKPLGDIKTSAPLRSSDRKKLKQKVVKDFGLHDVQPELPDLLVPDGLLSAKFNTHLGEPGVVYLAPEGDPLWFTLGKSNDDLIPTVYTLWKHIDLLPWLLTPAPVIPVLVGGADLMIPGVIAHSPALRREQLVGIRQYQHGTKGTPLAVGWMAVGAEALGRGGKGKAVHVLHTWKDSLWAMGGKGDPPEPDPLPEAQPEASDEEHGAEGDRDRARAAEESAVTPEGAAVRVENNSQETATPPPSSEAGLEDEPAEEKTTLSAQDVSTILRTALLQALSTTLSSLPTSALPIPASTFYTVHLLPARPASLPPPYPPDPSTPLDIKHSAHKTLTAFLRAAEKEGLLKLKGPKGKGKAGAGDVLVVGVAGQKHDAVAAHIAYRTVGEVEAKREKKEEKEREEREKGRDMGVTRLWKPHQQSVQFFAQLGQNTSALYTQSDLKTIINTYILQKSLVNPQRQQFINVDDTLHAVLSSKTSEIPEQLKREEIVQLLGERMQAWHRIEIDGKEPVLRKGEAKPISVTVKLRQGRKACTLITNFEPFLLDANALADELRHLCASSTTVSPLPGKGAGLEVMVQGKQIKAVVELLAAKGISKRFVETTDLSDKKK